MGKYMGDKGGGGAQKKLKKPSYDVGETYANSGGDAASTLGVVQAHKVGTDARTQLSGRGRTQKVGGSGKGKKVKGRSDDRRKQVASASAPIEKTIIGSSGKTLGA